MPDSSASSPHRLHLNTPFLCPSCKQSLKAKGAGSLACSNNHSFDIAKEGYLNLLLAQHKRSKQPGDDATMMACRQQFLNTGHYEFLVRYLAEQFTAIQPANLLDIGCGEGYYGQFIEQHLHASSTTKTFDLLGIDIAKTGVRLAAKRRNQHQQPSYNALAVASAYDLPLTDSSIHAALSVFAPLDANETARVLVPGATLITVGPASNHLQGLAEQIYETFNPHQSGFNRLDSSPQFIGTAQHTLNQTVTLTGTAIYNLLTMTPYYWSASQDTQQKIKTLDSLTTPLAFEVKTYRRLSP
ncbi:MAG: methyltransferase domain-containing protein [Marinagarivorans sp.]|nr:methyltransferase domain-containing protein [Marinagarivorans sp.]